MVVARLGARLPDHGEGLGLGEAGEIEEVGALAVRVEDGARPELHLGRPEDGHRAGGKSRRESGTALVVFMGRDAGRDWRVVLIPKELGGLWGGGTTPTLVSLEEMRVRLMDGLAKDPVRNRRRGKASSSATRYEGPRTSLLLTSSYTSARSSKRWQPSSHRLWTEKTAAHDRSANRPIILA